MRKTFKNILEDTFNNYYNWSYYSEERFTPFPLNNEDDSERFIKSFIKLSGKSEISLHCQINKLKSRSIHVVSAFLLGHYLYQNSILKSEIDKEINKLISKLDIKSKVNFSFMWYLICLFHDIGFKIEEEEPAKYKSYEDLLLEGEMPSISGVPKFYNTIYKNYFKYRVKEHCKNDHGIVAAHIMYNELCKIRDLATIDPKNEQVKLCWENDLEKIYSFCSWNVLAHNIWFGDKDKTCDKTNYTKYKMKRLLFDGKYKIKPKEHAFFFLFCLVDSIEPYKRVLDLDMLDQIYLEVLDNKIVVTSNLKCSCGDTILKQAKDLDKWLTRTKINEKNVDIYLK